MIKYAYSRRLRLRAQSRRVIKLAALVTSLPRDVRWQNPLHSEFAFAVHKLDLLR